MWRRGMLGKDRRSFVSRHFSFPRSARRLETMLRERACASALTAFKLENTEASSLVFTEFTSRSRETKPLL